MTYEQAREFVEETKQYGSVLGLESIRELMKLLGDIQDDIPCIHVGGTNGKGSVCAFLSSALTENGYKVGRYQSPAVFDAREIYRIGEEIIDKKDYTQVMERVKRACEQLIMLKKPHPTVFEVETAAAFLWFKKQQCDLVILEVGMGGATDATNIIKKPICSVLTSIAMDHMQFLGDTLKEIAQVKAGIIKEKRPIIALEQEETVCNVIKKTAEDRKSELFFAQSNEIQAFFSKQGMEFVHPYFGLVKTKLCGNYQRQNLAVALEVLLVMKKYGYLVDKEKVREGIKQTCWEGRFEVINQKPEIVIDGAHNLAAAEQLCNSIQNYFTNREIIYIIGVLADKEHHKMLEKLLPLAKAAYFVTPDNPRALSGEKLAKEAEDSIKERYIEQDISEAVRKAVARAERENAVIVAWGSLSYLKEVKECV